eukprot:TRINITY_DN2318_c0_g2_i1.p5 TRINITY_DN2318_c0_g2~~TRINITY_DN2318_c0_g2_i1.p5  ORF type:complete len:117 (+),score=11.43 TRINITY_DN2318_c0_g2_i1:631-981(+)
MLWGKDIFCRSWQNFSENKQKMQKNSSSLSSRPQDTRQEIELFQKIRKNIDSFLFLVPFYKIYGPFIFLQPPRPSPSNLTTGLQLYYLGRNSNFNNQTFVLISSQNAFQIPTKFYS